MLDLKNYINQQRVRSNDQIRADEHMIYCFEPTNNTLVHWKHIMDELEKFYAMCGYPVQQNFTEWRAILTRYWQGKGRYESNILPRHNAVAFFHACMSLQMPREMMWTLIYHLIPYALACRGFVFGISFDREKSPSVRICDMEYITPIFADEEIYKNLFMTQAQLPSGKFFESERAYYLNIVAHLRREQECIDQWLDGCKTDQTRREIPHSWRGALDRGEEMFFAFIELYENYCLAQVGTENNLHYAQTKEQTRQVRMSAQFIFKMERYMEQLSEIKGIKEVKQNIAQKRKWLCNLKAELNAAGTKDELKAMNGCFPNEFNGYAIKNRLFQVLWEKISVSDAERRKYPILDETVAYHFLNNEEKTALFWYWKFPVGCWIKRLCFGPGRNMIRKVMPFYLCDHFINKAKPLRPFQRTTSRFSPKKMNFSGNISFCTHTSAVRNQSSHCLLYQSILTWCEKYFPNEFDVKLCNALYTYYRPHLVIDPPTNETHFLSNGLYILQQGLRQAFELPTSIFPQYAEKVLSESEFDNSFYWNPTRDAKRIRKRLQAIVTPTLAQQYKQLALLDPDGLGHSLFPKEWHCRMADWLSKVIFYDPELSAYVKQQNEAHGDNLAQVEIAIQLLCSQKIQDEMTEEVLQFIKRVLGPT